MINKYMRYRDSSQSKRKFYDLFDYNEWGGGQVNTHSLVTCLSVTAALSIPPAAGDAIFLMNHFYNY